MTTHEDTRSSVASTRIGRTFSQRCLTLHGPGPLLLHFRLWSSSLRGHVNRRPVPKAIQLIPSGPALFYSCQGSKVKSFKKQFLTRLRVIQNMFLSEMNTYASFWRCHNKKLSLVMSHLQSIDSTAHPCLRILRHLSHHFLH